MEPVKATKSDLRTKKVAASTEAGVVVSTLGKVTSRGKSSKKGTGALYKHLPSEVRVKEIPVPLKTQKKKASSRLMKILRSYPVDDFPPQLDLGTLEEFTAGKAEVK